MTSRLLDALPTHQVGALQWGPPEGPLVVALHGFPDSAWTWRRVGPLLGEAGHRVVAPFLRGYAPSGIPSDHDYSVRALAADARAFHRLYDGDERAVLVGHDWGAIAAAAVAGDPRSPYAKVATLAVPPLAWVNPTRATIGPWAAAVVRQPFHSWYIALNQVPGVSERVFARLTRRLWADWSPGYDATDDLAHLADAVPDRAHARAVVSYYRALLSAGTRDALAEPVVPLLHLHGDRDGCLDPRFHVVLEARVAPPAEAVLVPDAGHFLQLEQPDVVAGHLLRFLAT
ncbi:alpha/beta fold hydrolase [Nocardioides marmoribigeumensis]|uniref:Pimeloyl-ACP methyl ester carboxylesterase n=1 Tax=Nocardioides marmoribigeumensis TaxID=433649 RepID=A0ABU2BSK3_9ACTN|nr:alpha/beta hydrolase [Nocardioides marmoribigeumensis]MDR7360703.1 pimeloyl-ACP methyl ester carboxylesterase [Nocardioides marmoribigeumensis]